MKQCMLFKYSMFFQSRQKLSFLIRPFPFNLEGVYAFMFAIMLGGFCTIRLKMSKRNLYSWFSTVLGISQYMLQAENTLRNHTTFTFNTLSSGKEILLLNLTFLFTPFSQTPCNYWWTITWDLTTQSAVWRRMYSSWRKTHGDSWHLNQNTNWVMQTQQTEICRHHILGYVDTTH